MSEVNKPENADTVPKCPFDPEQYKKKVDVEVDGVAPVGSLPWALIQVYLGKTINRSNWDTPNEYIQLTAKSDGGEPIHIEKHDKHGIPETWEPTPEDLMACDWSLLKSEPKPKPEDCMLSFDIKAGTFKIDNSGQDWGYFGQADWTTVHFGTLIKMVSNKIGITSIQQFMFEVADATTLYLGVLTDEDSDQEVNELLKKNLYITVDNETYNVGTPPAPELYGKNTRLASYSGTTDIEKLGKILKQTDVIKRFSFNWK
ncbi:DUF2829 domain-containing protein [Xenorhabdus bovienii]|uniref:Thoeris anti-defense Tad2 family protein n=1 Tax=Xenorhabdus bovienii TaxID=40576 RepID=UPI0023B2E69C|nr:MW1434 family type I TA system toxin [Xenorhabdus bovienii]MDE9447502.1 DUF2829 domain-containing protein [Xenorhabdus bovienii]